MNIYIYSLSDPRTNQVRYVGQSRNPKRRATLTPSNTETKGKLDWLHDLRTNGLRPIQDILEVAAAGNFRERELWWIKEMHRRGEPLLNYERARLEGLTEIRLHLTSPEIDRLLDARIAFRVVRPGVDAPRLRRLAG